MGQCPTCLVDYAQVHDHIRKNHAEQSYTAAQLAPIGLTPCPDCGFACKGSTGISVHRRKVHNVAGRTALTQPDSQNSQNNLNQANQLSTAKEKAELAEIRRQNGSRARAISLGQASPETYNKIARLNTAWQLAQSQPIRASHIFQATITDPTSQQLSQLTQEPAQIPTAGRFLPQIAAEASKFNYSTLGPRKRRAHSPLAHQPQPNRLRASSTSSIESLDSLGAIIHEASQNRPQSPARPRAESVGSLFDSPRGELGQSQWAGAPTPAQRPEPTQQPDLEDLEQAHNTALADIRKNAHLQQLIAYSAVAVPEKRLHTRHAAIFTKTANRLAEAYTNRPSEKNMLNFLLLPRILAIALTSGNVRNTLEHYPAIIPKIPESSNRASPNKLDQSQPESSQQDSAKRAQKLLEDGLISRAARALVSEGSVAPNTPENLAKLRQKHPIGLKNPYPPGKPPTGRPITAQAIAEAIRTTHRETAPGLSGWTKPLLERLVQPNSAVSSLLCSLTNAIQAGTAPGRDLLTASRLIAISKKDGGLRPIAIGDLIYRIAAKAILRTHFRPEMLEPYQLGVCNPGGVEPAIFMLEEAITGSNSRNYIYLQAIDAENAFNSQFRQWTAGAIYQYAPQFFRAAKWAYNHTSVLVTADGHILASAEGIRQGDPFGPFFFSLGLRGPLREIKEKAPNSQLTAYLDDIYTLEKEYDPELLEIAEPILLASGLRINRTKSSRDRLSTLRYEGIEALGTYIGPEHGRRAFLEQKAAKIAKSLQLLAGIPKQHALLLLRSSLSQQLRHLLRQLDPTGLDSTWQEIDSDILNQASQLASHSRDSSQILTDIARILTTIPIRYGGLGLPIYAPIAADIYAATKAITAEQTRSIAKSPKPPDIPPDPAITPQQIIEQHNLAATEQLGDLLSPEEATILLENSSYLSRQWLTALPTQKQLQLTDSEITEAIRNRLMIPIRQNDSNCPLCSAKFTIGHEDACRQTNKRWTQRHDQINRVITKTLAFRTDLEVAYEPPHADDQKTKKKPDFSVLMGSSRYHYDTQVIALNKGSNKANPARTLDKAAVDKRTKHAKYSQFFHPLIFSAGGLMEKATATIYRNMQRLIPHDSAWMDARIGLILTRARCHAAHHFELVRTGQIRLDQQQG